MMAADDDNEVDGDAHCIWFDVGDDHGSSDGDHKDAGDKDDDNDYVI